MLKTKVIPVRLDEAVWDVIQRAAKSSGKTASGYLRHAAIEAALSEGHSHPAILAERRRATSAPARPPTRGRG